MNHATRLGQFMTPEWVAVELLERYFADLTLCDRLLEPSCGDGAFLRATPAHVAAMGVEIDPALAQVARESSGRAVLVADFTTDAIPFSPTVIVGNPPFKQDVIQRFLDRAYQLLPSQGRVGFILPCYALQTPSVVTRLNQRWGMRQDMLPRSLFGRLQFALCFALLTKERHGKLHGFALYREAAALSALAKRYRTLLAQGERSVWAAVTRAALENLGGCADLAAIYREVGGARPRPNAFWQAKVRQTVQRIAFRVGPGRWALAVSTQDTAQAA